MTNISYKCQIKFIAAVLAGRFCTLCVPYGAKLSILHFTSSVPHHKLRETNFSIRHSVMNNTDACYPYEYVVRNKGLLYFYILWGYYVYVQQYSFIWHWCFSVMSGIHKDHYPANMHYGFFSIQTISRTGQPECLNWRT